MNASYSTRKTKFNPNYRKDQLVRGYKVIDNEFNTLIDCRIYQPSSVVYCALWLHGANYTSGTGKAGGYGYHKASAALSDAVYNAGIDLDEPIAGHGDQAMEQALLAIAKLVTNKRKIKVIEIYA